jgi:hypothetical protein
MYHIKIKFSDGVVYAQQVNTTIPMPCIDKEPVFEIADAMRLIGDEHDNVWRTKLNAIQVANYLAHCQLSIQAGVTLFEAWALWSECHIITQLIQKGDVPRNAKGIDWTAFKEVVAKQQNELAAAALQASLRGNV